MHLNTTPVLLCRTLRQCTTHFQGGIIKAGLPVLSLHNTACVRKEAVKRKLENVPDIKHFMSKTLQDTGDRELDDIIPPYMKNFDDKGRKVYFETYGCQMNVNDSEYAWAILQNKGYIRTDTVTDADVVLLVTCSIREKAEDRIWARLDKLKKLKKESVKTGYPKIGVLGCMAERLKKQILEKQKAVDVIAGPDAYRDLPRLLEECSENSTATINVMLSMDETYADIMPVRFNAKSKNAFVSIMRGCDNMCSYCIVPFTRGRERSRPISSILDEVRILSDQGIKQVTLLGQNVNSYRDLSETQHSMLGDTTSLSKGFQTIYKPKSGGLRFAELLDQVSQIDSDMRIRFTSPHPKDFPDEVLEVIKARHNICNYIHMPAQCGSTVVLERMRRGYSREDYLELAHKIRDYIPGVSLSTDMISGFCRETEADHKATLSLMEEVKYENAFMFAYSMRKKTHAYHRMQDNVPADIKNLRLREVIDCYYKNLKEILPRNIGQAQLVLVDGTSKKSASEMVGRNDGNLKVLFPDIDIPELYSNDSNNYQRRAKPGDYVAVKVTDIIGCTLKGTPIGFVSLSKFDDLYRNTNCIKNVKYL